MQHNLKLQFFREPLEKYMNAYPSIFLDADPDYDAINNGERVNIQAAPEINHGKFKCNKIRVHRWKIDFFEGETLKSRSIVGILLF